MATQYYIGVDVGTGSARAALVSSTGDIVAESTYATTTWRDDRDKDIFEQSSGQIWECIATACKDVMRDSKVDPASVKGIGFDATCSLVVEDIKTRQPVCVTPGSYDKPAQKQDGFVQDVVLWADHRAHKEAKQINATKSKWLKYVGDTISLEMEVPKMLWLKNNMPASLFSQCMFFDLPDWLTYRATDDLARSNCSLACKCSYVPPGVEGSKGWNDEFFEQIGLGEFVKNDFIQVGGIPGKNGLILTAGQPVGAGLSKKAAEELGLLEGTAVGSAVIDAYAGWIGTVAAPMEGQNTTTLEDASHRLAAVAGTSTCHLASSPFLRQSILLSSFDAPEIRGAWARACRNRAGAVRAIGTVEGKEGVLDRVPSGLRQVWTRFEVADVTDEDDRRFEWFTTKTLPTLLKSAVSSSQTLVFVPSYFDFVRLKRYLTKHRSSLASDFTFAAISEYTPTPDVSRARGAFFAGKVKFLLVTERFHFFRRYRLRGAKTVVFYAPPSHASYYPEVVSFPFAPPSAVTTASGAPPPRPEDEDVDASELGAHVLFSRLDVLRLERIVGTKDAARMCRADEGEKRFTFV